MSAKENVDQHLLALKTLKAEGKLDDSSFYKMVVCLSSEYIAAGEPHSALALLQSIPKGYYEEVQRQQMLEDSEYAEVAVEIAKRLVEAGVVSIEEEQFFFTQKDEGIA